MTWKSKKENFVARSCDTPTETQCTFHQCGGPTLSSESCHNSENFKLD